MWLNRVKVSIFLLFILFIFGCGSQTVAPPEPAQVKQPIPEAAPETTQKVSPLGPTIGMVEEYAKIHQISDLKKAEFHLTHPDYAKEHPYTPTEEDIAFYEREFLERMYPEFKELAAKEGFMEARRIYMSNPPFGPGSRRIGSARYAAVMQQLALEGGKGASEGSTGALLETDPAAVNYQEAMKLYKEGHLDDAIGKMEIAVKAKSDSPTILYNLGVMYMEKGDYAKAVQSLQSSLRHIKETGFTRVNLAMYPDVYMGALTSLGLIYTRVGMYNEAVKSLKEAIQFSPGDLDVNYNLGVTYYVMGDMEKATEQMRKCINLNPNNAAVHNIIGLMYYRKELYYAALDEFKIAAKFRPDDKQFSYNLGLVLAKLGRNDEANKAFQAASGFKEGEEVRHAFVEQTAENKVKDLYNEGYAAMESLNLTRAIELFKAVLEMRPEMMEAHFNLGVCYRMRGDSRNQIYHFEQAVKLKPDIPETRYNLGLAYSGARMYPQAIVEFRKAVELKPSFKDARFNLGTALYRTENYKDAAAEFEKCLELSPDWFEARLNLGSSYLKMENLDGAIEQFERAVQLKTNSAEAYYNLAEAYMRVEKFGEASALLQKALELEPGHKLARARLKELEVYLGK